MGSVNALLIKTNGEYEEITLDNKNLSVYQTLVGGFIELVKLGHSNIVMYVNEDGVNKNLPANIVATLIYQYAWDKHSGFTNHLIVGDVIILGHANADGYDTSIPVSEKKKCLDLLQKVNSHFKSNFDSTYEESSIIRWFKDNTNSKFIKTSEFNSDGSIHITIKSHEQFVKLQQIISQYKKYLVYHAVTKNIDSIVMNLQFNDDTEKANLLEEWYECFDNDYNFKY